MFYGLTLLLFAQCYCVLGNDYQKQQFVNDCAVEFFLSINSWSPSHLLPEILMKKDKLGPNDVYIQGIKSHVYT